MDRKPETEFAEKDQTIDDLIRRAEALTRELNIVVASMRLALMTRGPNGVTGIA